VPNILQIKKGLDIDLTHYEKKTFKGFLSLYLVSMTIFIFIIATLFFQTNMRYHDNSIISDMRLQAKQLSAKIIRQHMNSISPKEADYSTDNRYEVILLDSDYCEICTKKKINLDLKKELNQIGDMIYLVESSTYGHLGIQYIIVKYDKSKHPNKILQRTIFIFGFIYIVMIIIGYFLAKLFIQPIITQRKKLDDFIKDTTHELNTPVTSLILCSSSSNPSSTKNLERIKLSAKRVSEIYQDLTYLFLEDSNKSISSEIVKINLKDILDEQIGYFEILASKKKINFTYKSQDLNYAILKEDFIRLSNNLISNAIKYTNMNGNISIELFHNGLSVIDDGIGISQEKQNNIFDRFYRATSNDGGFGIGLNIVKNIIDKYELKLQFNSKEEKGSGFIIDFK
jgi:two-component system OmpR family sensor kinase